MIPNKYFVSRQAYYYSQQDVVEIAIGGCDYSGTDMLSDAWPQLGEGREYSDPCEAAKAAKAVLDAWTENQHAWARAYPNNDEPLRLPQLTVVNTGGMSIEGEPMAWKAVWAWAEQEYERLPKCECCGQLIPGRPIHVILFQEIMEGEYCSESCAEKEHDEQWTWHFKNWLEDSYRAYKKKPFVQSPDEDEEVIDEEWTDDFDEGTFFSFEAGLTTREEILNWFDDAYPGGIDVLTKALV